VGALVVIKQNGFSEKDIDRLKVFADLAAISLRRTIMLEQLEKERERLDKSLQARDGIMRMLAHDLRNPLNTISMAVSILQNSPPEDAVPSLHELVRRSTNRMNRLIQDLVDEALIEREGALPITLEPHHAHSLAEEVCEITRVQARVKAVNVECNIDGNAVVYADRDRVLQVLTNLIDNALKFTPEGGCVTVGSQVCRDHVRFSVSDTGPGIPEGFRERVFEAYFQAPGSKPGSGLGLAIARQIVEQHGGRIWIEPRTGPGTTFTFTLPTRQMAA
jgi:signal transduction histidine kinase